LINFCRFYLSFASVGGALNRVIGDAGRRGRDVLPIQGGTIPQPGDGSSGDFLRGLEVGEGLLEGIEAQWLPERASGSAKPSGLHRTRMLQESLSAVYRTRPGRSIETARARRAGIWSASLRASQVRSMHDGGSTRRH
jgi:hypothetical protein